ncbi:cache domain-containing sensor histidine kinase [Gorillibacterium massiliense]|uniref:cache domain-containing sensor histidine kinase n=1 Tax=Gorillibacterium massiliense TaxID=1280390 RepID=UPI0004B74696|nr:sensor histidine kinase [Gorillibacterium massiliense]
MFRWIRWNRLTNKAILFVVFLLLVPMLLIFLFASHQASRSIQEQAGKAFLELNRQNHATLDRILDAVDQKTVDIMNSAMVQQWNAPAAEVTDHERVKQYTDLERMLENDSGAVKYSIFLLTDHPEAYYFAPSSDLSSSGVFFIRDPKDIPWLDTVMRRNGGGLLTVIEKFGFNPKPQRTVAYMRSIVHLDDGSKTFGIVVATEIESAFQAELNALSLPDSSRIFLTDADGMTLAGSAEPGSSFALPNERALNTPLVKAYGSDLFVYHVSPNYSSKLIFQIPLHSLLGAYYEVQRIIQVVAACYFLAVLIFLVYLVNSVFRPLLRLTGLTRSYEPGKEMAHNGEFHRQDEIGLLYRSFYRMTDRLNEMIWEKYVLELKQKESELMMLHSQITPHLLYNSLDSIYWQAIRGGFPELAEMVRDLSTLLRIGLSRGKEIITIREELSHVEAYLHLQEKRYRQSFQAHIAVEEGARECLLPKVILQPLVENSILHGVGKMDGEGMIWIDIRADERELVITIEDNGYRQPNLAKIFALLAGTAAPDEGFGIRNVHKRIQLRFGLEYGLAYAEREEGGLRATIRMPAIRSAEQLAAYTA